MSTTKQQQGESQSRPKPRVHVKQPRSVVVALTTLIGLADTTLYIIGNMADILSVSQLTGYKPLVSFVILIFAGVIFYWALAPGRKQARVPLAIISFLFLIVFFIISVFEIVGIARRLSAIPSESAIAAQTSGIEAEGKELEDIDYSGGEFPRSRFGGSHLENVNFADSTLSESDFRNSTLAGVEFSGADLCGSDIRGADLRATSSIAEAKNLLFVLYNDQTVFPEGFMPNFTGGFVLDVAKGSMLYQCEPNHTRQLKPDGSRK